MSSSVTAYIGLFTFLLLPAGTLGTNISVSPVSLEITCIRLFALYAFTPVSLKLVTSVAWTSIRARARVIFISVILCTVMVEMPCGRLYSPCMGNRVVMLPNSRFIFFFTTSSVSPADGSLAVTASVELARTNSFEGSSLDFSFAVKVVLLVLLLIETPVTRYLYTPSSNTKTWISLIMDSWSVALSTPLVLTCDADAGVLIVSFTCTSSSLCIPASPGVMLLSEHDAQNSTGIKIYINFFIVMADKFTESK